MNNDNFKHAEITNKIIKAYYTVYNKLGHGFLEKVYERAMLIEMKKMGMEVVNQYSIKVYYEVCQVGNYFSDLFVEGSVIVEIKVADGLIEEHEAQLVNYLKATEIEVGLLLNFGKTPLFRRKVFSNNYKTLT